MKKLLSLSLIGIFFSINLSANEGLSLGKLKKIPLNLDFLSTENGGNKSAIDAYSDGIGIYTVGLEDKKFSAMNELVFKYGEEAKKNGETLKEHVLDKGNNKEQEIASLLGINNSGTVIGGFCDDGNPNTTGDVYIDTNGTCQGTETKNSVKCKGESIGSEFLVDGVSYLVVDNNIIKDNLNRAETLCTSNVTDLSYLFSPYDENWDSIIPKYNINANLNNWDTSNVTDMSHMFYYATIFNQPLNNWDTSNVINMKKMFNSAKDFNQNLNSWNVSKVTDISYMFYEASDFNQPLNDWDTSNVVDMNSMFDSARSFNQNINSWNVSKVIDMSDMFANTDSFNQPLNDWDTSNVVYMNWMFRLSKTFNQPLNNWNTSNVVNMNYMFYRANNFNQNLSNWNVNNVTTWNFFRNLSSLTTTNSPSKNG
jgi:surface protein